MPIASYRRRLNRKVSRLIAPAAKSLAQGLAHSDIAGPVFLIGPPRSGTTLLSQIMACRFEFASFRMLSAELVYAPTAGAVLERLLLKFRKKHRSFESDYGRTRGLLGLHEAGEFWYRWFPRGDEVYVAAGETSADDLDELRQELRGLAAVFDVPLLHKNTYNSMRIAPLVEAFPEACFLVSVRDRRGQREVDSQRPVQVTERPPEVVECSSQGDFRNSKEALLRAGCGSSVLH